MRFSTIRETSEQVSKAIYCQKFKEKMLISIKVKHAAELFDNADVSPFEGHDLDPRLLVGLERAIDRLDAKQPLYIEIAVESTSQPGAQFESKERLSQDICEDIRAALLSRWHHISLDMRNTLRRGAKALGVGMLLLIACLTLSMLTLRALGSGLMAEVTAEGLTILGWVTLWRPLEIVLYDWRPLHEAKQELEHLIKAHWSVVQASDSNT